MKKQKDTCEVIFCGKKVENPVLMGIIILSICLPLIMLMFLSLSLLFTSQFLMGFFLLGLSGTFIVLKKNNKTVTYTVLNKCWSTIKHGW